MGKGTKMCKYKNFKEIDFKSLIHMRQTIICTNENITNEYIELVNQNQVNCSRRLCPFYESR